MIRTSEVIGGLLTAGGLAAFVMGVVDITPKEQPASCVSAIYRAANSDECYEDKGSKETLLELGLGSVATGAGVVILTIADRRRRDPWE